MAPLSVKVALVYPYFRTHSQTEMLFPPLGLATLAGQLRQLDVDTRIFDCTFQAFQQVEDSLVDYHPDIVGIYCMVTMSRSTFRLAEVVRQRLPDCLLAAGGPLPTLYPEHFSSTFDAVFRGESDLSFPQFCYAYQDQKLSRQQISQLPLQGFPGLFIQQPGLSIDNPVAHYTEKELANFPLPDRSDFDHQAYQSIWQASNGSKTTSLMTTLGCPFSCDFCSRPVFGDRFRRRDINIVFQEIEQIISFGYDSLWIADDNFTLDRHYLQAFCERIEPYHLHWSCLSRVTGLTPELIQRMKSGGCQRVYLGLETGSQATLDLMKKRATLEDGIRAVHLFREAGIEVAAFFIVGYPGETLDSIESTFAIALNLPLDAISFNVPFPLPGSQLFDRVSNLDETMDWNIENEVTFVYKSEFDEVWLRRRIQETMQTFAETHG